MNAGYSVVDTAAAGDSTWVLSGEIIKVYADAYFEYGAEVSLFIRLRRGEQEVLGQSYTGEGSAGMNVTATAKSYAQSLALALADLLRQLLPGVEEAISAE